MTDVVIDISTFKDGQYPRWDDKLQKFVGATVVEPTISYRNPSWIGSLESRKVIGIVPAVERIIESYVSSGSLLTANRLISAGTGLTGGGRLNANVSLALATVGTAGTYTRVTVDDYGRVVSGEAGESTVSFESDDGNSILDISYDTAVDEWVFETTDIDDSNIRFEPKGGIVYLSSQLKVINDGVAAGVVLTVKGYTSQSANLQEWQNSAGTVQASIAANGDASFAAGTVYTDRNNGRLWCPILHSTSGKFTIGEPTYYGAFAWLNNTWAGGVGIIMRGAASQTADLQQWQNSGGTVLACFDSAGRLGLGTGGTSTFYWTRTTNNSTVGGHYVSCTNSDSQSGYYVTNSTSGDIASVTPGSLSIINPAADAYAHLAISTNGSNFYWYVTGAGVHKWANAGSSGDTSFGRNSGASGGLIATVSNATFKVLTVQGYTSQSANLQEWQNSAGTVLASLNATCTVLTTPLAFAIGNSAVASPGGGSTAIAIGYQASASHASNQDLMAIGRAASCTGSAGTALGYYAGVSGANGVAIGNSASSSGSNATAIGPFSYADHAGSVAIGARSLSQTDYLITLNAATALSAGTTVQIQGAPDAFNGGIYAYSMANLATSWVSDVTASRTARLIISAYYTTTAQEAIRIDSASDQARVAVGGAIISGVRTAIHTGVATDVGLVVKGTTSQSATLQQWQDSTGTALTSINADGSLNLRAGVYHYVGGTAYFFGNATNLIFETTNYTWRNNSGNSLMTLSGTAGLDVLGNTLTLGADVSAVTRTNSAAKVGYFVCPHYSTSAFAATGIITSSVSGANNVYVGGGSGGYNAATDLHFYTGATTTTLEGTRRLYINSTGNVLVNGFTSATVGLTVKGASSQSAYLQEWQNSAGTTLAYMSADGKTLGLGSNSMAVGTGSSTASTDSTALGCSATATGLQSTCVGQASAAGTLGTAVGRNASQAAYGVALGANCTGATGLLSVLASDNNTSAVATGVRFFKHSSDNSIREQFNVKGAWATATDASRTARLTLETYYTSTAQEAIRIDSASDQARVAIGGAVVVSTRATIYAGVATDVPLAIVGAASQSASLQQWCSNVTVLSHMTAAGALILGSGGTGSGGLSVYSSNVLLMDCGLSYTGTRLTSYGAAYVPLVVKGATSQSANLQEWQNSAGTALARVNSSGNIILNNGLGSDTLQLGSGITIYGGTHVNWSSSIGGSQIATITNDGTLTTCLKINSTSTLDYGGVVIGNAGVNFRYQSDSTYHREVANITSAFAVNTDASRSGRLLLSTYYTTTAQEAIRIDSASDQARVAIGGSIISGVRTAIYAGVATDIGLVVKGATSQSANLQEWHNVSGTTLAKVTSAGGAYFAAAVEIGNAPAGTFYNALNVGGNIGTAEGHIRVQNSGGTTLGGFDNTGAIIAANSLYFSQPGGGETGTIKVGSTGRNINDAYGTTLTVISNGSQVGSTNQNAGDLILSTGISTGTGTSKIVLKVAPVGSTGTTDNTPVEVLRLSQTTQICLLTVPTAAIVGLVVKGAVSQSANLQEWQNNSSTTLAAVSPNGNFVHAVQAGITASTTQTQGQGALTKDINEISTVANANDTVTLPTAVAGMRIFIRNNGANTLQIFPASSDNINGTGVNTAVTLAANTSVTYHAIDATNWYS